VLVEPAGDLGGVEVDELADLQVGDAPFGDEAADVTGGDAELLADPPGCQQPAR